MNKIYDKNPVNLANPVKNQHGKTSCRVLNPRLKALQRLDHSFSNLSRRSMTSAN